MQLHPQGLQVTAQQVFYPRTHRRAATHACFVREHSGPSVVQQAADDLALLNADNELQHAVRTYPALAAPATPHPSSHVAKGAAFGGVLHPQPAPSQRQPSSTFDHVSGGSGHQQPYSEKKAAASRLTRSIKGCQSLQQLQKLHMEHRHDMDFIHLSALITHLAQLHDSDLLAGNQQFSNSSPHSSYQSTPGTHTEEWVLGSVLPDLSQLSSELRPREAANVVWALAKLGLSGSPHTSHLLAAAWAHIPGMGPQELSNTLYASALLQQPLPTPALEATHRRLVVLEPQLEPQAVSNIIWSLGCLQQRLHPAVTRVLLRQSYAQMYRFPAQGLCHLAYGLARMRVKMPTRFRERLLDAAWRLMQQQAGQAADQQQHHSDWGSRGPQAAWQPGSEHQQHRQPLPMSAQSLVQLLWALVKDGRSPHPRWVAACLHQISAQAPQLAPIDVSNLLWALAQMHMRPPVPLLQALLQLLGEQLEALPSEGLACVAWALSELRVKPTNQWADRYLRVSYKGAMAFWKEAVGSGSTGAAAASRRQRLTPEQGAAWSCRAAATILYALAKLSIRPTVKYVSAMLAVALLPASSSSSTGGVPADKLRSGSIGSGSTRHSSNVAAPGSQAGSTTTPQDLCYLATALPALGHAVPDWGLQGLSKMADLHLHKLQGHILEETVAGLRQLGVACNHSEQHDVAAASENAGRAG